MNKIFGLIIFFIFLSSCDDNPLKNFYGNTVLRVENCMKETSTKLVDEEIIRSTCVKKIQKTIKEDFIDGKAGINKYYSSSNNDRLYLRANINNISDNLIYTELKITVKHTIDYGNDLKEGCSKIDHKSCKKINFNLLFKDLWIQPGNQEKLELPLNKENFNKSLKFDDNLKLKLSNFYANEQKDGDKIIQKPNWSWRIDNEQGVIIK